MKPENYTKYPSQAKSGFYEEGMDGPKTMQNFYQAEDYKQRPGSAQVLPGIKETK
jgi:hypothetical protein